jgi:transcriptional regulator
MYQPPLHREDRLEVQHALIETHPSGLLISTEPDGLLANGVPFILRRDTGAPGLLKAHSARANSQWETLDGQQVLVVPQGPLSYVTPSVYQTKKETGLVVPTWNHAMLQVRGVARVHTYADWLNTQTTSLPTIRKRGAPLPER